LKVEEQKTQIVISWDRENKAVNYNLVGMSHVEAQRLLQEVLHANLEYAIAEAHGHHHHEEDLTPNPSPERRGEEEHA
jgi:hypothetical protein